MGNIFGSLGRGLANAGEAAVKASPYALNAVMQVKAEKDADLQKALQQLYQRNADNRAEMASSIAYSNQLGSRELNDARVNALRNPSVGVQYIPDANGNLVAMPKKIGGVGSAQEMPGPSVTPSSADPSQVPSQVPAQGPTGGVRPIATGVKVAAKPAPRIDPLSTQGVTATADRAGKVAAATAQYRPKPQQPGVFVADPNNPTAPPVYTPRDQAFGSVKPVAAGAGGGQSLSPDDRLKMLNQARLDNQTMKRIEQRVLDGKLKFGSAAGVAGAASQAHGGVGNEILGTLGNAAAGAMDPDIQNYFTAQASYGRIMGNLQSKRYTDHQADIERRISGMQGNDLRNTIQYKQALRDASLSDSQGTATAGGRGGAAPAPAAPTATREQQLWDAAVAKHGKEKVLQEYGPRPGGGE